MNEMKLSVVIPAHNEEESLPRTLEDLQDKLHEQRIPYEIIVVNDNSTDGTGDVIQSFIDKNPRIRTVDRNPPGGFGRAVRSGIEAVRGDAVVVVMADNSDDPDDVVAYYRKLEEGYDCVFGSRFIKGGKVQKYPLVKLVVNRIVNKCVQLMFWCPYNDLTNAFKAYRTEVIQACGPYRACHFNITLELSLSALIRNYSIAQIPIKWYGRTWGNSRLSLRKMGRRYLQTLLKVFAEKLLIRDDLLAERLAQRRERETTIFQMHRRLEKLEHIFERTLAQHTPSETQGMSILPLPEPGPRERSG